MSWQPRRVSLRESFFSDNYIDAPPVAFIVRDGNSGTGTRYPSGTRTGMVFYPWVTPVPDPNRDGYEMDIFFTRG
jgi:hypothetical protein